MNKKRAVILAVIMILLVAGAIFVISYYPEEKSFSKTSLIKMKIPVGGESSSQIKITNYEEAEQNFNVYLNALDGLGSVSEGEFNLGAGESRELQISLKDSKGNAEIYSGELVIETSDVTEKIPVILGVEDPNYAFAIIYSTIPKYDNIYLGGKLGVEIKVYEMENIAPQVVEAKYSIRNFNNEVIFSDETSLVVEGSKAEIIDIPKTTWAEGDYILVTEIEYKGTVSMADYLFSVGKEKTDWMSGEFKFFMIIVIIFIVVILALFFYFIKTRDEFLIQLKKQQAEELARNVDYVKRSKEIVQQSKETPKKKEKKLAELTKAKERIVKRIKTKQKEQIKRFKELKKKKKKPQLESELNRWKKEGYKMFGTEKEVRKITKQNIKRQMEDWKEKGYATGFLKNKKNL